MPKEELTDFEKHVREKWQESWQGTLTYYRMCIYTSFIFLGIGLGAMIMTRYTIQYAGHKPQGLGTLTKQILVASMGGFAISHLWAWFLSTKFL